MFPLISFKRIPTQHSESSSPRPAGQKPEADTKDKLLHSDSAHNSHPLPSNRLDSKGMLCNDGNVVL